MPFATFTVSCAPGAERAADVFAARLRGRGVGLSPGGFPIAFALADLPAESFEIEENQNGIRIAAGGLLGLIHGAGAFLRGMRFSASGASVASLRGRFDPQCAVRGMYFASHFHNYYHVASDAEMERYLEDLALMGVNYLKLIYPLINIRESDEAEKQSELARHVRLIRLAHGLGMKVCEFVSANFGFMDRPEALKAKPNRDPHYRKGDFGPTLCLSEPGAQDFVDRANHFVLAGLKDCGVDMVISWPYDEGGCGCPGCSPWGANGFLQATKRAFAIARSYFPKVDRCVSTWVFDTPYDGEWEALDRELQGGDFCEYVLADSHTDFPRYPLEHGIDRRAGLLNFPEISMWGLFPWGGWGATLLPQRFQRLFQQCEGRLQGGFPYSEGIYEDVNVAVVERLYWDRDSDWKATLSDYAAYEFGLADTALFVRLAELIEKTHTDAFERGAACEADYEAALRLAEQIDAQLPDWGKRAWRWRQIYLRAFLDAKRYRALDAHNEAVRMGDEHSGEHSDWPHLLAGDREVQAALDEVAALYHCEKDSSDPYHHRVSPIRLAD